MRFLRDAGLLSQVTHITSVSGGSVLGAHLVLNWDRYCGSDDEFRKVTEEILRLLQLDVRNRIVRRFSLTSMANIEGEPFACRRAVNSHVPGMCLTESLRPRYRRMKRPDASYLWELDLDFSSVPIGDDAELVFEGLLISEFAEQYTDEGRFQFSIPADTGLAQIWMLMPENRDYEHFEISGWPIEDPELTRSVIPSTTVELPIGAIATFQLINPKHDYRYECRWKWSDGTQ